MSGNYLRAVFALAADLKPSSVSVVTVKHDSWCVIWAGRPCDCAPDLVVRPLEAPS